MRLANIINSVAVFTEVVGMVGLVVLFAGLMIYKQPSGEILWERGAQFESAAELLVQKRPRYLRLSSMRDLTGRPF